MAQCAVPNTLTNGQTADATQVMANFNSLVSCINSAPAGSTNAVQVNAGSGSFGAVGPLTNGQLVIGSTGGAPQAANLTAGSGISITNGSGSITISGASAPAAPAVRGTGIQASSASSYTVSWPSGTVAGDTAIIFAAGGWYPSTPSGWTLIANSPGSYWQGAVFAKILTSSDITAGSVTVSFSGTYDSVVSIVTYQGGATVWAATSVQSGSGATSASISSPTGVVSTDSLLYFGSNRAASTNTVSIGTLQRQANDGSNGSGCLYTDARSSGSVYSGTFPNFLFSSAGSGYFLAVVAVRGSF
jgi:hypothetical protein